MDLLPFFFLCENHRFSHKFKQISNNTGGMDQNSRPRGRQVLVVWISGLSILGGFMFLMLESYQILHFSCTRLDPAGPCWTVWNIETSMVQKNEETEVLQKTAENGWNSHGLFGLPGFDASAADGWWSQLRSWPSSGLAWDLQGHWPGVSLPTGSKHCLKSLEISFL